MLKALVFDYNGVLLNDLEYQVESYWKAGRNMGFDIAEETVRRYISYRRCRKKICISEILPSLNGKNYSTLRKDTIMS